MSNKDKQISGTVASRLADSTALMGKLEVEMKDLQWRLCWADDLTAHTNLARKYCRELSASLRMLQCNLDNQQIRSASRYTLDHNLNDSLHCDPTEKTPKSH